MKIFITGASSGLGFYLAKEFMLQGDSVWGIGRRKFGPEDIETSIQKNFTYSRCDMTVDAQIKNTYEEMVKSDFIPDIVIFCAGSAAGDITGRNFVIDKFRENFSVNLFGVLYWVGLLLPHFLKRNKGIFAGISSMSIYRENHRKRIGYSASKLALNKSFENLRLEYLNTGINFIIFSMGRMKETKDLIGTSYARAAGLIVKVFRSRRIPQIVHIPFSQYFLTRIATYLPDWVFCNYLMK